MRLCFHTVVAVASDKLNYESNSRLSNLLLIYSNFHINDQTFQNFETDLFGKINNVPFAAVCKMQSINQSITNQITTGTSIT